MIKDKLRYGFNVLIITLTIIYPFFVIYTLNYLQPRFLALILAGLFLLRFLLNSKHISNQKTIMPLIVLICFIFLIVAAWANQINYLLIYPVIVSLLFLLVFSLSLIYPPPIIERLARLEDPELPEKGIIYTRKVTQIWSLFFLCNTIISAFTVWYNNHWLWSLYNGCIFYILMGLLMVIEMTIRRKVKANY